MLLSELEAQLLAKWPTLRPCYLALQANCQQVALEEGITEPEMIL